MVTEFSFVGKLSFQPLFAITVIEQTLHSGYKGKVDAADVSQWLLLTWLLDTPTCSPILREAAGIEWQLYSANLSPWGRKKTHSQLVFNMKQIQIRAAWYIVSASVSRLHILQCDYRGCAMLNTVQVRIVVDQLSIRTRSHGSEYMWFAY